MTAPEDTMSDRSKQKFEYKSRLKRWGSIRDALGLNPATESIDGVELTNVEEVEIGGVNGATVCFKSDTAVEEAKDRLKEHEEMCKDEDCFSEAQELQSFRLSLSRWHDQVSNFEESQTSATPANGEQQ